MNNADTLHVKVSSDHFFSIIYGENLVIIELTNVLKLNPCMLSSIFTSILTEPSKLEMIMGSPLL